MRQYLDIVKKVLHEGKWKSPVRKNEQTGEWEPVDGGVRTLACPNIVFSHDMAEGFPLITTKKMAFRTMCVELEGFIKGITDKEWYQERKCKIWDQWANPEAVASMLERLKADHLDHDKKSVQKSLIDLGPIYGYQWRKFNKTYTQGFQNAEDGDWSNYTDQLKNIVETLTNNPMDRRMVCSAWNPNQIKYMALPPCHYSWNVTVIGDELNLFWAQRSCDLMLGVPFNIASYGLLLTLLAQVGGFKRGNLSGMLVDCHIYENQIEAAKEQVERTPSKLPELELRINSKDLGNSYSKTGKFDLFDWTYSDVILNGYNPQEKISFGDVVV